jgi:hypothetical protein
MEAVLDANYEGTLHRLFITPLAGMEQVPWTLVTYRNLALVRLSRIQAMVDSIALYLLFLLLTALPVVVVLRLFGPPAGRLRAVAGVGWWAQRSAGYPFLVLTGALVVVIVVRALQRLHGPAIFLAVCAAAAVFLVASGIGLRRPGGGRRVTPSPAALTIAPGLLALLSLALGDWVMAAIAPAAAISGGPALTHVLHRVPRKRYASGLHAAWLTWCAELVLVLCILPAFALCRLAHEYERGLYVRDSQWDLWKREAARRQRIIREVTELPGLAACPLKRDRILAAMRVGEGNPTCPPAYLYASAAFNTLLWPRAVSVPMHRAPDSGTRLRYDETCSLSPDAAAGEQCRTQPPAPPQNSCPRAAVSESILHRVSSRVVGFVLARAELPTPEWKMGDAARRSELQPAGELWKWETDGSFIWLCSGDTAVARSDRPQFASTFLMPPPNGGSDGRIAESLYWSGVQLWTALAALVAGVIWWIAKFKRRVLLEGVAAAAQAPIYNHDTDGALARLFLRATPGMAERQALPEQASLRRIDCALDELTPELQAECLSCGGLLLAHLEARFGDRKARLARLELLEQALLRPELRIVLISTIDCVRYLETGGAGGLGAHATPDEIARWHAVLNHFAVRSVASGRVDPRSHAAIWDNCSYQEKLVLVQLDKHRLVSPGAAAVAATLLARGLLRRRASGRLDFSATRFRRFVASAQEPLELELGRAGVVRRRLPSYAVALVLAGVVMFLSQEELTSRLLGFVTTLAGGLEALRKQVAAVNSGGGDGAPQA